MGGGCADNLLAGCSSGSSGSGGGASRRQFRVDEDEGTVRDLRRSEVVGSGWVGKRNGNGRERRGGNAREGERERT